MGYSSFSPPFTNTYHFCSYTVFYTTEQYVVSFFILWACCALFIVDSGIIPKSFQSIRHSPSETRGVIIFPSCYSRVKIGVLPIIVRACENQRVFFSVSLGGYWANAPSSGFRISYLQQRKRLTKLYLTNHVCRACFGVYIIQAFEDFFTILFFDENIRVLFNRQSISSNSDKTKYQKGDCIFHRGLFIPDNRSVRFIYFILQHLYHDSIFLTEILTHNFDRQFLEFSTRTLFCTSSIKKLSQISIRQFGYS